MAIVAYRYIPPCFDSRYGESNWTTILPNLPPENRELFLINELHKIKNPFSLFRQQDADFQISNIWANALHCTYRINFVYQKMELQGNIEYLWKKKMTVILEHI